MKRLAYVQARRGLAGEGGVSAAFVQYAAQDWRVKGGNSWGMGASQGANSLWGVETRYVSRQPGVSKNDSLLKVPEPSKCDGGLCRRRGGVYAMTPATVNSEEAIKTRASQVLTSSGRNGRGGELGVIDDRPLEIEPLWR